MSWSGDLRVPIQSFEKLEPRENEITGVLEPHPRSGHRIVADDENLYSIGGYNPDFWGVANNENTSYPLFKELWQFNFASRKWIQLKTYGAMPLELASHSAILHGHHLVVFGGTGVPFGDSATNNLSMCNLKTREWQNIKCSGKFPIRVYGQSMYIHGDQLYIFGGTTGWEYNSEIHSLDLHTKEWNVLDTAGDVPEGRYRHEVACHNGQLFVFGGGRSYLCYEFDKIPVLDLKLKKWAHLPAMSDRTHGFPAARRCHSCVQFNSAAYICGGYDGGTIFGDIWRLCLEKMQWTKLATEMPKPVYFHSAAVTSTGCMYVYGGVTEIDTVRTSAVHCIWLVPPTSLKELCWAALTRRLPDLDRSSRHALLELGFPLHLLLRISPHGPGETLGAGGAGPSVCA